MEFNWNPHSQCTPFVWIYRPGTMLIKIWYIKPETSAMKETPQDSEYTSKAKIASSTDKSTHSK